MTAPHGSIRTRCLAGPGPTEVGRLQPSHGGERAGAKLADSRRLAALSGSERDQHRARSLILAVESSRLEDTLEARSSLLDALLTKPGVTSFLHRARGYVATVAFSPDGQTLAAAGFDEPRGGELLLWDVARLAETPLAVPEGHISSVVYSPDGKTLALGGAGGVLLQHVARRGRQDDKPVAVAEGRVTSVAFGSDGKTLAAGPDLGIGAGVVMWDRTRRARLADEPLAAAANRSVSVAFSPDGKTLAAGCRSANGGSRGAVVLFDLDLESWNDRAGKIANRNLAREEWRQYFPDTPYHATFDNLPTPPEVEPTHTSEPATGEPRATADQP